MGISEQNLLYGQLVVDFANARSTDEVGLKYFENLQKTFGFSRIFSKKAKNAFPLMNAFLASFTDDERKCLDLLLEKREGELGILCQLPCYSLKYNPYSKIFSLCKYLPVHFVEGQPPADQHYQEIVDRLSRRIQNGFGIGYEKGFVLDSPNAYEERIEDREVSAAELEEILKSSPDIKGDPLAKGSALRSLTEVEKNGDQIRALKTISEGELGEIEDRIPYYRDLILEHEQIELIGNHLSMLLDDIIFQQSSPSGSLALEEILCRYNTIPNSKMHLSSRGEIWEQSPFNEELFLSRGSCSHLLSDIEQIYGAPLSYCVLKFLVVPANRRYLKKCRYCGDFFVAKHVSRLSCYGPLGCQGKSKNKQNAPRMRQRRLLNSQK